MNLGVGCKYKVVETIKASGIDLLPGKIFIIEHIEYQRGCLISIDANNRILFLHSSTIRNQSFNTTEHRRNIIRKYYNSREGNESR